MSEKTELKNKLERLEILLSRANEEIEGYDAEQAEAIGIRDRAEEKRLQEVEKQLKAMEKGCKIEGDIKEIEARLKKLEMGEEK